MNWTIAFLTYLFTIIPSINTLLTVCIVVSCVGIFIFIYCYAVSTNIAKNEFNSEEGIKEAKNDLKKITTYIKRSIVCAIFFTLATALFPSQKDVALIVGLSAGVEQTQNIVQSDRMQRIGGKSLDAIEAWLDQTTADTNE